MAEWTEVSYLDVRLASGENSGSLYANGRHQAAVVISLVPGNAGQKVDITQAELDSSITLVDYVTGREVGGNPASPGSWQYGTSANEFHRFLVEDGPLTFAANPNGLYQTTRFVTCSNDAKMRTKSIAVQVKPTYGAAVNSSQNGSYNGRVVLTALDEIAYRRDVNVRTYGGTFARVDGWQQTNYFLAIANNANGLDHYILKADISPAGGAAPFMAVNRGLTARQTVAWAWPFGAQATGTVVGGPSIQLAYNQRPNEVCISMIAGFFGTPYPDTNSPVNITLYDQYGNMGIFHAKAGGVPGQSGYGWSIDFLDGAPYAP